MTLFEPLCPHGKRIGCIPPENCSECMEEEDRKADQNTPFLQALRSVGGIKPCRHGEIVDFGHCKVIPLERPGDKCSDCHGTGQILDLAPLLAKPDRLHQPVYELIEQMIDPRNRPVDDTKQFATPVVVGPQRAHPLVYEVARQLGGTAVVAKNPYDGYFNKPWELSIPMPPNAAVLFVTDRMETDEMNEVMQTTDKSADNLNILQYVLCLISNIPERTSEEAWKWGCRTSGMKIISLYKEKS